MKIAGLPVRPEVEIAYSPIVRGEVGLVQIEVGMQYTGANNERATLKGLDTVEVKIPAFSQAVVVLGVNGATSDSMSAVDMAKEANDGQYMAVPVTRRYDFGLIREGEASVYAVMAYYKLPYVAHDVMQRFWYDDLSPEAVKLYKVLFREKRIFDVTNSGLMNGLLTLERRYAARV